MSFIQESSKSGNEDEDFQFATQLATGSILYMAMQVAIKLNVFGIIAKSGSGAQVSPRDIVSQLPAENPNAPAMLNRLLRLLTSHSILTSSLTTGDSGQVERQYGLGPVCKYFVPDEDGISVSPLFLLEQDKVLTHSRSFMKDTILEGGVPFNKAHGMHVFEYIESDFRFNQAFNTAMYNITTIFMKKMLETYNGFEDLHEIADVGGGIGTTIGIITKKYPKIKGTNFDLPQVISHAPPLPGVQHVGGDMFEGIPTREAIFLKSVLHDWSDECCLSLLKNCYKALPAHGKLIVVEAIIPLAVEKDVAARSLYQHDVIMMTQTPGGKERTAEEFDVMAKEAGFACMKKVCCVHNFWVLEFYKT